MKKLKNDCFEIQGGGEFITVSQAAKAIIKRGGTKTGNLLTEKIDKQACKFKSNKLE